MTPKDVRTQVVSLLTAANVAGGRIYEAEVDPIKISGRTCVAVYIPTREYEISDPFGPITYKAYYEIEIDCIVPIDKGYADTLDDLIETVKTTLFGDEAFYSLFVDTPSISESITLTNEGEYRLATGQIAMTLQSCVEY